MKSLLVNWKTTGVALLTAILAVLNILYPATFTAELNTKLIGVLVILGFGAAKDGNVTGGTTTQPSK